LEAVKKSCKNLP